MEVKNKERFAEYQPPSKENFDVI